MMKFLRLSLLCALFFACRGEPDVGLRAAGIGYSEREVAGLSPGVIRSLADLTTFGRAVARAETASLGEPLVERAGERARLRALSLYLAAREAGIGEEELRQVYEQRPEWQLTVRHLVRLVPRWAAPAERQRARSAAEAAQQRAAAGEDFSALAAEYSEEPGAAERGGLLQPGREGSWVEPFWAAALALRPSEVSPVVETEYGFHVIRLEGRDTVPLAEADRTRLLAAVVSPSAATASMERWVGWRVGTLRLDEALLLRARESLGRGEAPDTLVIASWEAPEGLGGGGGRYTAHDLALFLASLDSEERERLGDADHAGFARRIERDAQEAMLAADARALGVAVPLRAAAEAERDWATQAARWAHAVGFREGMSEEEIRASALRSLGASGQEARIARPEIEGIRPLLWTRYGVSGPALDAPAAASNSPTP